MKDIHCHILFGIDDGSPELEESIQIIRKAKESGYNDLILTPHYRANQGFMVDNRKKVKLFNQLKKEVKEEGIDINLYLGNEITLDEDFFYYLKTDQILSLAESRYLLIELPFDRKYPNLNEVLSNIMELGFSVVIAHPERYQKYKVKDFEELVKMGVLLQGNIGSLYRKYGKDVENKLKEMLRKHMIHFIGSDVHKVKQSSYTRIYDVKDKVEDLTGSKSIAEDLVKNNIEKVINNEVVIAYPIRKKVSRLKLITNLFKR